MKKMIPYLSINLIFWKENEENVFSRIRREMTVHISRNIIKSQNIASRFNFYFHGYKSFRYIFLKKYFRKLFFISHGNKEHIIE